MDKQKRMILP